MKLNPVSGRERKGSIGYDHLSLEKTKTPSPRSGRPISWLHFVRRTVKMSHSNPFLSHILVVFSRVPSVYLSGLALASDLPQWSRLRRYLLVLWWCWVSGMFRSPWRAPPAAPLSIPGKFLEESDGQAQNGWRISVFWPTKLLVSDLKGCLDPK